MLKKCEEVKELQIEEYWGVLKDLQRVFKIEVDADKQSLYDELNKKIADNEIDLKCLDEKIYQHYLPVAATRHEIFEFGIDSDEGINETITDLKNKVIIIEAFEKKNAITENIKEAETPVLNPADTGLESPISN